MSGFSLGDYITYKAKSTKQAYHRRISSDSSKHSTYLCTQLDPIKETPEVTLTFKEMFDIFDYDKRGYITKDNIQLVMRAYGEELGEADLRDLMFGKIKLSWDDLCGYLKLDEGDLSRNMLDLTKI